MSFNVDISEKMNSYQKVLYPFLDLLTKENPDLRISFHTSFDVFGEEYKEYDWVAQACTQPLPIILKVDGDYELPFEQYDSKNLLCTSWRNNGYDCNTRPEQSEQARKEAPEDFDVLNIQGNPLAPDKSIESFMTMDIYIYTIGGCAKKKEIIQEQNKINK